MKMKRIAIVSAIVSLNILIVFISSSPVLGLLDDNPYNPRFTIDSTVEDTEPPSLVIIQPENLSSISGWFILTVEATDNDSVDKVVYREMSSQKYIELGQNESDSTKYRALVDSRTFKNGVNFIEIIANDTSNNINRSVLLLAVLNLEAEADIYVYNVTGLTGECPCLNDDNTSQFWNTIQPHPIEEFNGYIKFSHNFTHLFGLFAYDVSLDWISFQFDNDGDGQCMEENEDMWWFHETDTMADYTSKGYTSPIADNNQDLVFEAGTISTNTTTLKFIEAIRSFTTDDPEDVVFKFGTPIGMIFASSESAFHQRGLRTNFTLALRYTSPEGFSDSITFGKLSQVDSLNDLIVYGGIGFAINASLIVGLVVYNKKRLK